MTTRIVEFADGFTSATPPDTTGYLLTTNVGDDLCPLDGDHLVPLVNLPVLTNAKIPLLDIDKIPVLTEDKLPMIPSNKLPSYVDDVVEVANYAALPVTGETGKIYIALDTNVTYRWSGSAYVQIGQNITSTDNVSEGATNKYYTATRAQGDAVVNAVTGGETNKAPSVAAIKAYVDANSSNGVTDVDVLAIDNYDAAQLADYTQTGLAFNTTTQIHGVKSAQLIHDPLVNQSYKKVIAVDRKFRGQMIELSLANRSTATDGNLTLLVTDETNSAVISASQSIQTDSFTIAATTANTSTTISGLSNTDANKLMPGMAISGAGIALNTLITSVNAVAGTAVISVAATASATVTLRISALPKRRTFTFTVPQTCASLSYTVTALPEANSPRSTLDDVVFKLASMSLTSTSVDLPVITTQSSLFSSTTAFGNVDITGALSTSSGSGVYSYNSATGVYTFLKAATVDISASLVASSATQCMAQIQYNATQVGLGASTTGGAGYGGTTSWTGKVAIGDTLKVRNSTSGTTSQAYISVTATAYDTSIKTIPLTQSALIQDADSTIRLDSHNGYGSTANKIPRFTNIQQNIGDAILYTDSSVNGASFTVLKSDRKSVV